MGAPPSVKSLDPSQAPKELRALIEQASKQFGQVGTLFARGLTFGENLNCQVTEPLSVKGAAAWIRPTLLNSWVDFSGSVVARYRRLDNGRVVLSGAVKSGTLTAAAFVLSAAYIPGQEQAFAVDSNGAFGELVVQTNGNVIPRAGSATHFALSSAFQAADEAPESTLAAPVLFRSTLKARPAAVWVMSAVKKSDKNSFAACGLPAWSYQQDGQVRVTSIPGLVADTDYLVSFLAVGG